MIIVCRKPYIGNNEADMRKLILLAMMGAVISCSSSSKSASLLNEEELYVSRKYIGDFIDYSFTGSQLTGGPDLIWIRTSVYTTFGTISAYGKICNFSCGDRIYLRPLRDTPGNFGHWEYLIENDHSVSYTVSDFKYENNAFVRSRDM